MNGYFILFYLRKNLIESVSLLGFSKEVSGVLLENLNLLCGTKITK